jgi:hypothetical protein
MRAVDHNLSGWDAQVPTFKLDVDWQELSSRPKNTDKDKEAGEAVMEEMKEWKADSCSARWTDRNGKPLLAYFADHIELVSQCTSCFAINFYYGTRTGLWNQIFCTGSVFSPL